jgi:hypothetical protein
LIDFTPTAGSTLPNRTHKGLQRIDLIVTKFAFDEVILKGPPLFFLKRPILVQSDQSSKSFVGALSHRFACSFSSLSQDLNLPDNFLPG